VLRGGGESDGSGNTGVSVGANVTNNVIQNNVFTGLAGVAAAINGNDGLFANNYVGTIANGTVPGKTTDPSLICSQWDWLGGSGISLSGNRNIVENNIFAGLRIAVLPPTIQADTIRMGGDNHIIRNNKIGLDVNNAEIGVCGRGIYLLGGTEFNQITTNRIIKPGLSAISLNDTPVVSTSDANTLRGNVIKKLTPWGEIEGNNSPEDAIQITKSLPDAFRNFKPAQVTNIDGTAVSGTNGAGSSCPNCIVELFLDDTDAITETLQSLAVVTANNASGNWTATLPAALTSGQALRTTSTSTQHNTIPGMSLGTLDDHRGAASPRCCTRRKQATTRVKATCNLEAASRQTLTGIFQAGGHAADGEENGAQNNSSRVTVGFCQAQAAEQVNLNDIEGVYVGVTPAH
jgi:hypothetical protein